jgi:hypothetical protein
MTQQRTSCLSSNSLEPKRLTFDVRDAARHLREEAVAESGLLRFIPGVSIANVRLCFGPDNQLHVSTLLEYPGLYFGPGRSSGRVLSIRLKAAIKLCFLRFGELQRFRNLGDAVPDRFHESESLRDWQSQHFRDADGLHCSNLPPPRAVSNPRHKVTSDVRAERVAR